MTTVVDEFIARAREVSFEDVADRVGVPQAGAVVASGPKKKKVKSRSEYMGPCPRCGGEDRFAVNRGKRAWICRGCGRGGKDGLGLAAHWLKLDLSTRSDFLEACSAVLQESIPVEAGPSSPEEIEARRRRIAEAERRTAENNAKAERDDNAFREREIERGRGIWLGAVDCRRDDGVAQRGQSLISRYITGRTGFSPSGGMFENIRYLPSATYWHGQDAMGRPLSLYCGPALVAPFVDSSFRVIGSQTIWIRLSVLPKRRPVLFGLTREGRRAGYGELDNGGADHPPAAELLERWFYQKLSSKKMRGAKKGGLIPICGDPEALRWLGGEGIETTCAVAGRDGWRDDTFYFASGDIGNLAGPRDPDSDFFHPVLKTQDAVGRWRRVKVQGPVPRADIAADDAMWVGAHVRELFLLADGDSEKVATVAAMARAEALHGREGRVVDTWWPPEGLDFAEAGVLAGEAE